MTTYTKFKEYIWLVNTIYQAKAITLAEINRRWLRTLGTNTLKDYSYE